MIAQKHICIGGSRRPVLPFCPLLLSRGALSITLPLDFPVKKRCNDIKKSIKKAQDDLEAILAAQLDAIPEEVRFGARGHAHRLTYWPAVPPTRPGSCRSQFLSMPVSEYLSKFADEVEDEERIAMEKFAQTSGSSAPAEARAAAPVAASVAETPSAEQAGTTVTRTTRTRTRTAAKTEPDLKILMPPPPPVTGASHSPHCRHTLPSPPPPPQRTTRM